MDKQLKFLFIFVILAAGVIAYSNSFDCSFHFDDNYILYNGITGNRANMIDWLQLFPTRPLGVLTFAANYNIHKLDVWGYHLVNLLIHLINALLVSWLTFITFSTPVMKEAPISRHKNTIAFLTGLLFVTHPLATQSVTYIAQRFASLSTLFYLLSMILFVEGRLRGNSKTALLLFGASILSAACGILTKEIVFTLPFAIILYDYCFIKIISWKPELKDKSLIFSFVMLAVFILFFLRNFSLDIFSTVQPTQGYTYPITMKEYFLTQFRVILTYIRLFFLPFNQNLDYDYFLSTGFFQIKTFFSFLALLGIVTVGVFLFRKYRLISFGIFWFFLTLSVESSIIPISQNVIFEHRTYLPSFGFFIAFTGAFFYIFREKYFKVAFVILLLIAVVNIYLTYQRNKIWKNEYTLWCDCLKKSPNKARTNNNFGVIMFDKRKGQRAMYYFNKAVLIDPNYDLPYYNRAKIYILLGQYQKAIEDLSKAISIRPSFTSAYQMRGQALFMLAKIEAGCKDAKKACELGDCDILQTAFGRGLCR